MNPPFDIKMVTIHKGRSVGVTTTSPSLIAYYLDTPTADIKYDFNHSVLMEKWTKKLEPLLMDIIND